jgi:colicin import membrane protein
VTFDDANRATAREVKVSRALAVAIHVAFLLLLVFGISWQRRHSEPAPVAELWSSLPPLPRETSAPPPRPAPKIEAKPKPEPKPAPKPEVKPVPKPDIALKDKLEKDRKKKLKAQEQLEQKKKEEEKKKLEKEKLAQEAEAKRLAQEKEAIAKRLAAEQASAQSRIYDEYVRQISNKIKRNIIEPPNLQGNPQVEFEVRLLPGGDVMEGTLRMRRSSGVPAYDQAVERAILKASPLPLPPDPALFNMFRELNLKIRPKE